MKRSITLLALAAIAACSTLPDAGSGVVALEVTAPDSAFLSFRASLTLHAQALNLQGDSIAAAAIFWYTPDTALATLDTARGIVTARAASGIVRVQAKSGSLLSTIISITLRDSIASLVVAAPDSTFLSIGSSQTLHAQAHNLNGDLVATAIFWRTPDTALATLDTVSGTVTARAASGIVHVQARTGSLLSNVVSFTLRDSTHATSLRQRP